LYHYVFAESSHPELKQLVNMLQPDTSGIAIRWYDIGIQLLDSDSGVLDIIKGNYPQDISTCCREMFKEWLDRQPGASWNQLIQVLVDIDMKTMADKIKSLLKHDVFGKHECLFVHLCVYLWLLYTTSKYER